MINGFHSNWTKPFFCTNKDKEYEMEDFNILTTILSALEWRKHNGSIKMITDKVGLEYYKKLGIESVWDGGIESYLDDVVDSNLPGEIFWAAGKIYALAAQTSPCVMIDTDLIVWKPLDKVLSNKGINIIHKELITELTYPGLDYFNMKEGYEFDPSWDWTSLPCNTTLLYINNMKFIKYYTDCSIKFMESFNHSDNYLNDMVFAEQRLLSMCAKKMDIEINEIANLIKFYRKQQVYFTHVWGYKIDMRSNSRKRRDFCISCIERINKDFPEYSNMISNIEPLKHYFNK